jgi:predicted nucleic acid-binding protein
VSHPAFSRDAVAPRDAVHLPSANTAAEDHVFWPDEAPFAEITAFAGPRLLGHQQVADAYLLGLALRRGGSLATFDRGIAEVAGSDAFAVKALAVVA